MQLRQAAAIGALLGLGLSGCAQPQADPAVEGSSSVRTAVSVDTTLAPPADTVPTSIPTSVPVVDLTEVDVPYEESRMTADWTPALHIETGPLVGASITDGPGLPAPAPDGSWWIADTFNYRLLHLSDMGELISSVGLDPGEGAISLLRVLNDGSVIGATSRDRIVVATEGSVTYYDGPALEALLGVGDRAVGRSMGSNTLFVFNTDELPQNEQIDSYVSRSGANYTAAMVSPDTAEIMWEGPAGMYLLRLRLVPDDGGQGFGILEFDTDSSGNFHLLFYGSSSASPFVQRSTYVRISPIGAVTSWTTPNPLGGGDPGTLGHIVVAEAKEDVYLTIVESGSIQAFRAP